MEETSRRSILVDINLAIEKGLKFYQTRSNAIILHEALPAYCISESCWMETGEVIYEKVYASPRPPPKIFLKHDWMKYLGSEVAQQPDGQVVQQSKSSQSKPNQIQTQIMMIVAMTQVTRKVQEKRPVLRTSKHVSFHEEAV